MENVRFGDCNKSALSIKIFAMYRKWLWSVIDIRKTDFMSTYLLFLNIASS